MNVQGVITGRAVNIAAEYQFTLGGRVDVSGGGYAAASGPGAGFSAGADGVSVGGGGSYGGMQEKKKE